MGLVAYYVALVALLVAIERKVPRVGELFAPGHFKSDARAALSGESPLTPAGRRADLLLASTLSIGGALAVALPVAWVYVLTRRRKGFMQSIVHTLVVLPIAVAGVVVLVQDSLALAFSLAGIVAAVRFRNTLEDTKDAVYIFVATGVGIAAAVGELSIGLVTSVIFNLAILVLWWTEFGRAPANLEGSPAVRRLEKARSVAAQGGEFVEQLDREVLSALSPAQLESLAGKAWRRRQLRDEGPGDRRFPFRSILRVHGSELEPVQLAVESVLVENAKRWELSAVLPGEFGGVTLEYLVRIRKSVPHDAFLTILRARGGPQLVGVELR